MMRFFFISFLFCSATALSQVKVGDVFPDWSEGYLDIHHINTGKGECAFFILPDGTTMLVDAGASRRTERVTPAKPDDSRTPGQWIVRYISQMMRPFPQKKLDYVMLTHFHDDHIGAVAEVAEHIPFDKIVDRNWPDYDYPFPLVQDIVQNYIKFVKQKISQRGVVAEQFRAGANDQFKLVRRPEKYPEFEIRNIVSNGQVWTGTANNVRSHFPPLENLSREDYPNENHCSSGFRLSYGKFDYFTGGDLLKAAFQGDPRDVEGHVGRVVGPVEVCVANHHANHDTMGEEFLSAVRPKVIVIQVFVPSQPDNGALNRMLSRRIYPGSRDIFATNVMEETRIVVGNPVAQLKSQQGHVVVRVHPGGNEFMVYILDDSAETFRVKSAHGPYICE